MAKKTQSLRQQALHQQHGCCFYCGQPVWEDTPAKFSKAHRIPSRLLKWVRNTAEHVVAQCDGGTDCAANVVAACYWCNRQRHQGREHRAPDAAAYRAWVQRMMAAGKWHPVAQHRLDAFAPNCHESRFEERTAPLPPRATHRASTASPRRTC